MKTKTMPKSFLLSSLAFFAAIAMFAPTVNAQTSQSLQAQINALLAQVAALQAQLGSSTSTTFTRDLTIGASGADVTALQNWLIKGGYAIPAGATGYFGAQSQSALARYQTANGIVPASGYFGPITRARVNATVVTPTPTPTPNPTPDNDNDEDEDRDDAQDSIESAQDALSDARDEVEEADDDGDDIGDAEDLLDEAEDLINDAEESFGDEDYDEVMDLIEEAEDLIGEALDEIDSNDDEDDDNNVSTSAKVSVLDGANNDYATFKIEFDLTPFNQDAYIAQDADVSIEYEIQDSDGDAVATFTTNEPLLNSSADEEGDYFLFEEDEEESLELTVTYDPVSGDEGASYRLQILSVNFAREEDTPDQTWNARPSEDYRTAYVYIGD